MPAPAPHADPLLAAIEDSLSPGGYVTWREESLFVHGLGDVEDQIAALVPKDPKRAVMLFEIFLAACFEKAEEVHDDGGYGMFVQELFASWVAARQAAGADADETVAKLFAWEEKDDYGFCSEFDRDVVGALNAEGLAAMERAIKAPAPSASRWPERRERRTFTLLRAIYLAQRNIPAFVELCERAELTPDDCKAVASLLGAEGKHGEALRWVDRGLAIAAASPHGAGEYELSRIRRELLMKVGRGAEALDAAWAEYEKRPSKFTYDELMKFVPGAEKTSWHERALMQVERADLSSLIDLLLSTGEIDLLVGHLERASDAQLESLSHFATEPAAKSLAQAHPALAGRLWRAQGMRIVNGKKSKYYAEALSNFENAMRCYAAAGLDAEWQQTVTQVRADHYRKKGFIAGFEALVVGRGPSKKPTFLERATARWSPTSSTDKNGAPRVE